ncbi:hypothetical protein J2X86_002505 [Acinetobacter lwoffii]|uniref:Replication protein n=1 Tax=Acinetobacter lwoffii TaxID=28090 RepID=A0AAW8LLN1_ACILW|nr:hypothetical protein [Acinetobacter lwoffii]MDR6630450.1 hypothetical protein [Acinetobacter lwoffii]
MTSLNTAIFEGMVENLEREKRKNIHRAAHNRENPYTVITNKLLRDTSIKHSDRGLMCQLLSWSDHHNLCIQAIVKKSVEGRDAIRGMVDRLVTAGYIRMTQIKGQNGQFDRMNYQIFEESTGVVVADLDLSGILQDGDHEESPQLNLFGEEILEGNAVVNDQNIPDAELTADGFSVSGKHDTNKYCDSRSTIFNNNPTGESVTSMLESKGVEIKKTEKTKAELLNTWYLQINDSMLQANLGRAGLGAYLTSQEQLDNFLIDFNQQHDKYKNINHTQRLKNFTVYLLGIKSTRKEHIKHVLRMQALGFNIPLPTYAKKPTKQSAAVQTAQTLPNTFAVQEAAPFELSADYQASIEGF